VGNYISFDRQQAEGYARALAKQKEREAKAAEPVNAIRTPPKVKR
jgi:hypothetical protein